MVLRLRHQSNDDASKEKSSALLSKAFKITDLVRNFNGGSTTNKLKTIKIIIQQQKEALQKLLKDRQIVILNILMNLIIQK